jgi:hypothetical protein
MNPVTKSMPAAAHAAAHGHKLIRLEPAGSGHVQFIFDDPEAAKAIQDYFDGGQVQARSFYKALQDIRGAINRTKNGGAI